MRRAWAVGTVVVVVSLGIVSYGQVPALLPSDTGPAVPLPAPAASQPNGGRPSTTPSPSAPMFPLGAEGRGLLSSPNSEPPTVQQLLMGQQSLAESFEQFQAALVRWSELSQLSDRRRAAALRRAIEQSQEKRIAERFAQAVNLLQQSRLADAMLQQQSIQRDLEQLLQTLLQELSDKDRESLKEQLDRIRKEISLILRQQKQLQGRTAAGEPEPGLAPEQGALAEQTDQLAQQIRRQEGSQEPATGPQQGHSPQSRPQQGDQEQSAPGRQPGEQAAPSGEPAPRDSPDQAGRSQESLQPGAVPSGSPPSQAESSDGSPQQASSPPSGEPPERGQGQSPAAAPGQPAAEPTSPQGAARQRLEQAQQHMRQAEDRLRQAQRSGAVEQQEEAIRQLEKAQAQLEEILRQMRKDEILQLLAALETRFRHMLNEQRDILAATTGLDAVPAAGRDHAHRVEVGRLGGRQAKQVQQAESTLTLLREDGSSAAFAETTAQLCDDLRELVALFADADVGQFNQSLQQDVIRTLEEMIEALKQAQRDLQQRSGQPMQAGEPGEMSLVNLLAEIKMIRTLQLRVNRRTSEYGDLLGGRPAGETRFGEALGRLAERQQQIADITRNLYLKKNR